MKMRDLERLTGVNRETIRIYLKHGLMPEPQRPARNVADYGAEHVRAIEAIRQLQKERRLPLNLIKRAMDGDTTVMPADASAFPHLDSLIAARAGVDEALLPLASLVARDPHAASDARILEKVGAVELIKKSGKPHLSRIDAQLVGLWGQMRAAGFTEALGFTPEVCRMHTEAAEKLARAELKLFLATLTGKQNEGPTADMAQAALTNMLSFFGLVRTKAVLKALRTRTD